MNSPDANWVFDYGAYLPVSGRQDGFYYRIWHSMFQANSISIINHNAMDTGYWAGDGFHQTGGLHVDKTRFRSFESILEYRRFHIYRRGS